jgi:hypothetical protein
MNRRIIDIKHSKTFLESKISVPVSALCDKTLINFKSLRHVESK